MDRRIGVPIDDALAWQCDSDNRSWKKRSNNNNNRRTYGLVTTGWPKKVSHYRESSLNRIKNRQRGSIFHQFCL